MKKIYLAIPIICSFLLQTLLAQEVKSDISYNKRNRTMVIQLNETAIDASVFSTNRMRYKNYGRYKKLTTSEWTDYSHGSPQYDGRAFMYFPELKQLDPQQIESAILTVYAVPNHKWEGGGQHGANAMKIERVTQQWNSKVITWHNQPSTDPSEYVIVPRNNRYDSLEIDLTPLIQLEDRKTYGFMFKQLQSSNYSSMIFYSSNHDVAALRPKLTLKMSKKYKENGRFEPMREMEMLLDDEVVEVEIEELSDAPIPVVEEDAPISEMVEINDAPEPIRNVGLEDPEAQSIEADEVYELADAPVLAIDNGSISEDNKTPDSDELTSLTNSTIYFFNSRKIKMEIWDPFNRGSKVLTVLQNEEDYMIRGYQIAYQKATFNLELKPGINTLKFLIDAEGAAPKTEAITFAIMLKDESGQVQRVSFSMFKGESRTIKVKSY